jgi:hypothetical protein
MIVYPGCTTYEGRKILVFENSNLFELRVRDRIDPHFSGKSFAPVARFEPTDRGWKLARIVAAAL